jgi:hypothetical protein
MIPYKMQIFPALKWSWDFWEASTVFIEANPDVLNIMWFRDMANFYFSGIFNKLKNQTRKSKPHS